MKGKSDPYVKINIGGETFTSQVIKTNLNPSWNEMYEVSTSRLLIERAPSSFSIALIVLIKVIEDRDPFEICSFLPPSGDPDRAAGSGAAHGGV